MSHYRLFFRFYIVICLAAAIALAQSPISVEAFDEQGNNPSQLTLRLRLTNNSPDTLENVRTRYFLQYEAGRVLNVAPYYLAGASLSLDTLGDYIAVNIDVARLAPGVFPNSSGISFGMNYTDYSDMEKAGHFSYPGMGNFVMTDSIPVYVDGTLLVGASPISEGNPEICIAAFQPENTSSDIAWIKVKNVGETAADMRYLALLDSSGTSFVLNVGGNAQNLLAAGDTMLICAGTPCSNGRAVPGISLGSAGELSLEYGSIMVDYVAWGSAGRHASVAVGNGLWRDSSDHLRTTEKVWGPSLPYESGSFFRRTNFDGHSTMDWIVFSPSEKGTAEGSLPNSVPFSWNDGVEIVLPHDAPMHFAWVPVPGALSYRLNIFSEDSVQVYQEETGTTYTDVNLPEGTYLWGVESSDKPVGSASWGNAPQKSARFRVSRLIESDLYVEEFSLHVEPLAARKDTRLLVPNWGMYADIRGWDQSHVGNPHWDEEESYRCWAVGVQELNRYFGGNLTQDEIKMYGMNAKGNKDSILGVFRIGQAGAGSNESNRQTLSWALGGVLVDYREDSLTTLLIKSKINDSLPMYIGSSSHIMVVDAYRIRYDGKMEARFLNPHNDGSSEWREFSDGDITDYWIYEKPYQVSWTDSLVHRDYDEDGIVNYDELYRFHTDSLSKDTDKDSIEDKIEIWSHTMREMASRDTLSSDSLMHPYNALNGAFITGVERELFADADGDGFRAELDPDSDDDNLLDREEDLNRNGTIDEGETDPYVANEERLPIYVENDVPDDFALYSLEKLFMNDGSSCRDYGGYPEKTGRCSMATESKYPYYAVSLAAGNRQNILYTKGGVLLRNRTSLNFVYFFYDEKKPVLNVQKGAEVLGYAYVSEKNWAWSVNRDFQSINISNQNKIIHSGESYTLVDTDNFNILKIESGGKLLIDYGEMFVGNLQVESGGSIEFVQPSLGSILHVAENVIWRGDVIIPNVIGPKKTEKMINIAKGFKMVYHGTDPLYIEGLWAGTIFAPNAKLVLGQANKTIYGRFVGNGITVHQYAKLYSVKWNPKKESVVTHIYR